MEMLDGQEMNGWLTTFILSSQPVHLRSKDDDTKIPLDRLGDLPS